MKYSVLLKVESEDEYKIGPSLLAGVIDELSMVINSFSVRNRLTGWPMKVTTGLRAEDEVPKGPEIPLSPCPNRRGLVVLTVHLLRCRRILSKGLVTMT